MPETKPTRGGTRKGAGRPRVLKEGENTNSALNLEDKHWQALSVAGKGNKSAGARFIIDAYLAQLAKE